MTVEKEEALKLLVKGVEKITEEEILVEKQTKGVGQETKQTLAEYEDVKYQHETQKYYQC